MKKIYALGLLLTFSVLFSAQAHTSEPALTKDQLLKLQQGYTPPPLTHITQGYETDSIQLNRGLDGKIKSIEARACASCDLQQYRITETTQAYIGQEKASLDVLTPFNGKSGAISYNIKTKELHHFRFFNLEAGQ
ncbi:hypothetical protein A3740_02455 [Oleiphilus sp. HI0068]|nr:hypothetical protein A3732_11310 [Oleiphilus sp. HI0050]KZY56113.1 hypothetical protein A3735_04900 [Oleiphilus sp. HI0061]KZY75351.1 hypothetical protein A3740_02455 [Oleiphilus sp. HI0068]KZY77701.1 hypothetical protein A3741_09220 [Oleiphilus sp. HI0069]KZZ38086.1 hypothetical protein A3756_10660 [Oleiphilus sp. HI0086]KZZ40262.1 hypothetical protein A3757_00820 [Oleiphilus sp. HI0117]KZZ47721.1 hypothetical protein A3755_14550 [Oleiphilus sp. HI0085]KZZ52136.1 hypothetical protein A37